MLLKGLEWVLQKTSNTDKKHLLASHCMAEDVGRIGVSGGIKQIALNHLIPPEREIASEEDFRAAVMDMGKYSGPVIVGRDGLMIRI